MAVNREDFDYSAFGARLKEAREKAGLTQAQVCEAIGIPKAQVLSSYERGVSNPPIDTLSALVQLYGVSLDDLVFAESKQAPKMSTGDWLFLLAQAAYHLQICPCDDANRTALEYNATGELAWGKGSVYADFFNKWMKLNNARRESLIDLNDFQHLLRRHANQVADDPEYKILFARNDELMAKLEAMYGKRS